MNLYNHTVVLLYMTSCSCVRKNACLSGIEQFIVFRCPQLISIYCGIVQYVVSDRPSIRLYSVYKNNQLRHISLCGTYYVSAIIIINLNLLTQHTFHNLEYQICFKTYQQLVQSGIGSGEQQLPGPYPWKSLISYGHGVELR